MPTESAVSRDAPREERLPAGAVSATVAPVAAPRKGLSRLLLLFIATVALGMVLWDPAWITASNEGLLILMGLLWVGVLVAKGASRG